MHASWDDAFNVTFKYMSEEGFCICVMLFMCNYLCSLRLDYICNVYALG